MRADELGFRSKFESPQAIKNLRKVKKALVYFIKL